METGEFTKEQAKTFFSKFVGGEHHLQSDIKKMGGGWSYQYYNDLATFDFDSLTRLVFLAHDLAIRVEIRQGGPGGVRICIWKRKREGKFSEKHPTIEDALSEWRRYNSNVV